MEPQMKGDLDRDQIDMMVLNFQSYFIATKLLKRGGTILIKTLNGYHEKDVHVSFKNEDIYKNRIFLRSHVKAFTEWDQMLQKLGPQTYII